MGRMKTNSNEYAMNVEKTIKKLVEKEIKRQGLVRMWSGTVTAYNGTTQLATLYLSGDESSVTSDYLNKSGQTLVATDIVELISKDGTLNNAYIISKRGLYA